MKYEAIYVHENKQFRIDLLYQVLIIYIQITALSLELSYFTFFRQRKKNNNKIKSFSSYEFL